MDKHTPGPWVLNGYQVERREGIARTIATVAPRRQLGADYAAPDANTAMANARLIAAAPELLELCERLLGVVINHAHPSALWAADSLLDQARETIKKARGE